MTEVIRGEFKTNELSKNSFGGTEQMAMRIANTVDKELLKDFQIIHSRVRNVDPDLKKILYLHDLHSDPEAKNLTDSEYRKQFDKLVFVSNWQLQMFNLSLGVRYDESIVIPNAIEPFAWENKPHKSKNYDFDNEPIRIIYHTTPHRGLGLLYPVFEQLAKNYNVHLDVFSSFKIYGWEERDESYKDLFEKLENHPNITYHGTQPNEIVREYLKKSHIFAYPSIWPETSCLAVIEALCAGNIVVHPNLAALPETCEHSTVMYQFNENHNEHANLHYAMLSGTIEKILENPESAQLQADNSAMHFGHVYDWNYVSRRWENLLKSL